MAKKKDKYARGSGNPNPHDVYVGQQLRAGRGLHGISQERLADAIGITFQQIQKYERATNRVSCSRLVQIAEVLDIPITYFFKVNQPKDFEKLQARITELNETIAAMEDKIKAMRILADS